MNKPLSIIGIIVAMVCHSCIIQNTKPEDCSVKTITVTKINEGTSYDIVFHDDATHLYYINRGLEQGLNLDSLNAKVLNKTVTLHLANLFYGTTRHIAQLRVENDTIFTEFE